MNKSLAIALAVIGCVILLALGVGAGLLISRNSFTVNSSLPATCAYSNDWRDDNRFSDNGMMGGRFDNMRGNTARGTYGCAVQSAAAGDPLSVDQARQAVEDYLANLNNNDLQIAEIMVFDNNAYARITEKSSGIGAMELLVDPSTLEVYPEYGPNMMWNLKYGHMNGYGMMGRRGGMMGYSYDDNTPANANGEDMSVSAEQALQIAQEYLDTHNPGYQTSEDADAFYGYYTIEILKDGSLSGMLSVNGYSGQVFMHTWHGNFIDMEE